MNSADLYASPAPSSTSSKAKVYVKELAEKDRHRILQHFLALEESDRLLRFGTYLPDVMVEKYVEGLDFSRDKVFGVMSHRFRLVGVGHLAFAARTDNDDISEKDSIAEFGVSVSKSARGKGVGAKLFERGAIHCRNADVDTLYMHCLASNQTMIHIARKAGMEIHREYGEADAYLKLSPADAASVLLEAVQEQVAAIDYTIKANARAAAKWLKHLPGWKDR
ncbi:MULTISPECIES: GNAT family N-acetyltransferase [unclassified Undibacterium]|uniref:GNAT family N-acetyltransferase n=1 Tax=unclassified Undibacterium TaxID=2630295 RepID=UPI002AC8CF36|nr:MULTISPECIES: GNAT family N-acetyltransferase [unclassified Undibacterium]MEB0140328.1 GNAT family N-acetyltransferase [Undibacterium sp. CCC2.1]MEB0172349.1 GNAT family N-acetyltransferase [Undibacterium sp. CCC1.1]MEB0178236.1 GNAT family N-acetyltransferase [Undibacterium sp. CCC3.4]MEB0215495.1 GNAT family N-acetyltransferase [Undibacterium sp. 5I2]WPX44359.1 GNAT family N-acetyltransferase [Undibacterium sp. CCC3.4]